jgi:probable HAF family extracellular repeat protein
MSRKRCWMTAVVASLGIAGAVRAQPCGGLTDLGSLGPPTAFNSVAWGVSATGGVLAGFTPDATATESRAFRWTSQTGMSVLPIPDNHQSSAYAVSANGEVVVGYMQSNAGPVAGRNRAVRWRGGDVREELGTDNIWGGIGLGVSADGQIVVGLARGGDGNARPGKWDAAGNLTVLPTPRNWGVARDVSSDGTVIVGYWVDNNSVERACLWRDGSAMLELGGPGGTRSEALAISADGQVVVGYAYNQQNDARPFRWTAQGGMQEITPLAGTFARAYDVNADGSMVVGDTYLDNLAQAFVWTLAGGVHMASEHLGGHSTAFTAVSPDGRYIAGWSRDAMGFERAIRLSDPSEGLPAIETQPTGQHLSIGGSALFNVVPAGPATGFRWHRAGTPLTDDARIAGATTPTLSLVNVQPIDQGEYTCVVTNACGSISSDPATLSCRATVTQPPVGGDYRSGDVIVLTGQATSSGTTTYRWRRDGLNLFNSGAFSGVTTRTLTIAANDPSQSGNYTLAITNPCGLEVSEPAVVVVSCAADWNEDGGVDGDDVILFFQQWDENSSEADFTRDGSVDGDDVIGFFGRWDLGC